MKKLILLIGVFVFLFNLSCIREIPYETYEKKSDFDTILGQTIEGKRNGNFIHYSSNEITELEIFKNDSIKERLMLHEGHFIFRNQFCNDSLVQSTIIDLLYYKASKKWDSYGKELFKSACYHCHFNSTNELASTVFPEKSEFDLKNYMDSFIVSNNNFNKYDLIEGNKLNHQVFLFLDSLQINSLSKFLSSQENINIIVD